MTQRPHCFALRPARLTHPLLHLGALLVCSASTLSAVAQSEAPDPLKLVRAASYNELRASNQGHTFRYRTHSIDDGKSSTKEIIETRDGDMSLLVEKNDKPLDADAEQAERDRLTKLKADPADQARRHHKKSSEDDRDNEMIRLLPDAFLYTFLGMEHGPNGPCYRLGFKPNPAFNPPDRQAQVYHGMAGELWIDQSEQRMVRLDAHLIEDVDFGWGVVGRLFKGGTILIEQKDVGERHWENTLTRLDLEGRILMLKSLKIKSTDESSDFQPVPNAGYQAAIDLLLKERPNSTAGAPR
ncbi:hypothetical protein [Acidipila sp. EB88]|uniref:hypothetical protein n=1 Tax=Acidipila sp. EB88 TaxID=2305226 RepID=UPI000F5E33FE|nr:hypothetical protein [Acidipila sp. EB88]RRA49412.1 hypothetical protein D1Y84_15130 [Acidipila sp. EB88]